MKSFSIFVFYLLILFLPTQLSYHFWPDFSFVAGIRIDYLAPTLYVTDILILLLFISWIINLAGRHSGKPRLTRQARMTDKYLGFKFSREAGSRSARQIILLMGIVLIGIAFSKNPAAGLYGFLKLLEFLFLGFYTAANINKLRFDLVLVLFSIGIIFESFLSILQFINQSSIGGIFYFFGERTFSGQTPGIANASVNGELVLRPYGTFPHPNVLAGYLTIAMAIVSSKFKVQSSKLINVVFAFSLILGTIALFLTMSRVAIILWVLIAGLWFAKFSIFNFSREAGSGFARQFSFKSKFENFKIKNSFQISNFKLKILMLALIVIAILLSPLHSRFTDVKLTDESIVVRQQLMNSSLLMIKENPILGVGINNFLIELPNYKKIKNYFLNLQPVHNIFLLAAAQTGIAGLGFFIWFIFKTYQRIMKHESRIKKKKLIIHDSKFMILSSVLILGLFDHYFLTLQQGQLLFSFVLGLCWAFTFHCSYFCQSG